MEPRARRFFFLLWVAACVYVDDQTVPCTRYTTVPFFPPSIIPFSCLRLLFISLLRREKGRERGGGEAALSEAHYHLHFFSCRLSSSPPPLVAPTSLQSERERERERLRSPPPPPPRFSPLLTLMTSSLVGRKGRREEAIVEMC